MHEISKWDEWMRQNERDEYIRWTYEINENRWGVIWKDDIKNECMIWMNEMSEAIWWTGCMKMNG